MDLQYWENYYKKHPEAFEPSDFAYFVSKYTQVNDTIVDLGCGNARDTIHFAREKLNAIGIDQCTDQIQRLTDSYQTDPHLEFIADSFVDMKESICDVQHAYSRFTLHSIDSESEDKVIKWASENVQQYFFIETRSDKDKLNGVTTDHYRRFVNMNELLGKLIKAGFEIEYAELSRNFSKYKAKYNVDYNEADPMLIRVVAKKL